MTDWYKNFSSTVLDEFDSTSSSYVVYQRRNFQKAPDDIINGVPVEVWIFDERQLSHAEYAQMRIAELEVENTNLQLALTELYEKVI